MSTAAALRPLRPARPACCHRLENVPGQPAISTASSPVMLTPSSRAVVAARPTRRPSLIAASRLRRSSGRYPDRYAATLASDASGPPSDRRAASATVSAPRRDLMKASVGTSCRTSRASRSAVCAVAVRRSRTPASPRASVSGGSHNANASGPRGEPSSMTSSASSPVSSRAQAPGAPTVAEASTNTGRRGPPGGA